MAPEGEREEPDEEEADGDDKDEEEEEQASSEEDTKKKKGRRGNVEEKLTKGGRPRRATAGRTRGKIKKFLFYLIWFLNGQDVVILFSIVVERM